jgi:hypothetical protein
MTCGRSTILVLTGVLIVAVPAFVRGQDKDKDAKKTEAVTVVNTPSQPIPVVIQNPPSASPTLLGPTKASQLVTLTSTRAQCPGLPPNIAYVWDQRVNADGSVTPFSIPAGMVLVVTGLDWRQGLALGANRAEEIFVYASSVVAGGLLINSVSGGSDGETGANVAVTGVVAKAGMQLCWQVNSGNLGSSDAVLHGFLAVDQ